MHFSYSHLLPLLTLSTFTTATPNAPSLQIPLTETSHTNFSQAIRLALKSSSIIPTILDDFLPKCILTPIYNPSSNSTKTRHPVTLGNKLKPSQTKSMPGLRIYCLEIKTTPGLTIALTDPKWGEVCHWITTIPIATPNPTTSTSQDLELTLNLDSISNEDLIEYKPPGPPPKTGYHRYIFVLLEGPNTNLTAPGSRRHWGYGEPGHGVRDWAEKEGLSVVGANFFIERNEK